MHALGLLPGEQHLGGGPGMHREDGADRHGVAQAREALGRGDADALLALAAVELARLAGRIAQRGEHRPGGGQQTVLAGGRRELAEPRAEDESALQVAGHEPVVLERGGESVGRRAGEAGGLHQPRQGEGSGLEGTEHGGRFVEDADSARVVHVLILPSQHPRWQVIRTKSRG